MFFIAVFIYLYLISTFYFGNRALQFSVGDQCQHFSAEFGFQFPVHAEGCRLLLLLWVYPQRMKPLLYSIPGHGGTLWYYYNLAPNVGWYLKGHWLTRVLQQVSVHCKFSCLLSKGPRGWEKAQQLRVFVALAKDLGSVPSTCMFINYS